MEAHGEVGGSSNGNGKDVAGDASQSAPIPGPGYIFTGKITDPWSHAAHYGRQGFSCHYCGLERLGGGSTRLKEHLGGLGGSVVQCYYVPSEVQAAMRKNRLDYKQKKSKVQARKLLGGSPVIDLDPASDKEDHVRLEREKSLRGVKLRNAVESMGSMSLYITVRDADSVAMDVLGARERWVAPQSLREFIIARSAKFSTLPAWIKRDPSHLSHLSILRIFVRDVRQEDLEILARLPALRRLSLRQEDPEIQRQLVVSDYGFRCLTSFELFTEFRGHIAFKPGALPKAEQARFSFGLWDAKEPAAGNGGDCFDLGLGNLRSLREVLVAAIRLGEDTEQVEDALEDALMHAISAHPNRPSHQLITVPDMKRLMMSLPAAIPNYGRMSERWSMAGDLMRQVSARRRCPSSLLRQP